jgi:eukaryotic-like serine/threonine-protein kinase
VKDRNKYTATPLAGTTDLVNFTLSPDGEWVAFTIAGEISKLPIDGGAGLTIIDDGAAARLGGIAWLDDGTIVYARGVGRQLARVSDQGGESTIILASDSMTAIAVQPLPGARGVLFQSCGVPCADPGIWVLDLESGEAHLVLDGATYGHYLPTGHLGFVRPDAVMLAVPFDLKSLQTRGTAVPLLDSVAGAGTVPLIAISASGTLVMRSGTAVNFAELEFELVWVDQTGRITVIDSSEAFRHVAVGGNQGWALSPDETQLAIGLATGSGDDIWVKSLPQGPLSKVSFDEGAEYRPRWMPDGESIIFNSDRTVNGLYRRRLDATGEESLMVQGAFDEGAISPDGRWILLRSAATSAAVGGRDILVVEVGVDSVSRPLLATPYDEEAIAISPDGRALAYQSDETGRNEVFVRRFPDVEGGKLQISAAGGTGPLWSRDGRELYYRSASDDMVAVRVTVGTTLQAGEPRVLFRIPADVAVVQSQFYTPWDVASDGRFIMTRRIAGPSPLEAPLIVVENWFEELKAKVGN